MSSLPNSFVTPEEYLEIDRQSDERYEYHNGEMFLMSGGSSWHAWIIGNIARELGNQLKGRACRVSPTTLRLKVTATGLHTYPDIMVICGEPEYADNRNDTVLNPVVIVEVLSPSTSDYDRGRKFDSYRTLPSLREYVTVAQDAARIVLYTRYPEEWRFKEFTDLSQSVDLVSIACTLPLAEVYDKINFSAAQ